MNWYAHSRINAFCAYNWIYEALTDTKRKELIVPLVEHVMITQPEYGLNLPRNGAGKETTGFYSTRSLFWYSGLAAHKDGFCDSLACEHLKTGYQWYRSVMEFRDRTACDVLRTSCFTINTGLLESKLSQVGFARYARTSCTAADAGFARCARTSCTAAAGALQSNDGRFAMLTSSFFSMVQPV